MSAVVDPTTGEVIEGGEGEGCSRCEALEAQAAGLMRDVAGLEQDVRSKNRRIAELKDELAEQRGTAPEAQVARSIFGYWREKTGRDKRSKFGQKRQKVVLARLREGHEPERIMRAIDGAVSGSRDREGPALLKALRAAMPLLSPEDAALVRRVFAEARYRGPKYDDLELICRDETKLEGFAQLAEALDE